MCDITRKKGADENLKKVWDRKSDGENPENGGRRMSTTEKGLVLCAVIRAASKYAYQGRENGKPVAMRVTHLEPSEYPFHLENGNRYRREDLTFYVEDATGKLTKLR
jgi:hypothetical protein